MSFFILLLTSCSLYHFVASCYDFELFYFLIASPIYRTRSLSRSRDGASAGKPASQSAFLSRHRTPGPPTSNFLCCRYDIISCWINEIIISRPQASGLRWWSNGCRVFSELYHSDIARHYPALAKLLKITIYDVASNILGTFDQSLRKYTIFALLLSRPQLREGINAVSSRRKERFSFHWKIPLFFKRYSRSAPKYT